MCKINADVLTAEIGSTTTVVTAITGIYSKEPSIIGQGQSETTVLAGDVTIGLEKAVANLKEKLKSKLTWIELIAASGLKMTVHGLVYDMTVKAAKEAALGAPAPTFIGLRQENLLTVISVKFKKLSQILFYWPAESIMAKKIL